MATPLVSGCVAVVKQALLTNKLPTLSTKFTPTAALVKALLIHYATGLSGKHQASNPWALPDSVMSATYTDAPDFNYGYGRVNVDAALLAIAQRKAMTTDQTHQGFEGSKGLENTGALAQGQKCTISVALPPKPNSLSTTPTLKATMAYSDLGGEKIQNYLLLSVQGVGVAGTKNGDERQKVNGVTQENNVQQVV